VNSKSSMSIIYMTNLVVGVL